MTNSCSLLVVKLNIDDVFFADSLELASLAVKLSQKFVDHESQLSLLGQLKVEQEEWDDIKVKAGGWMAFALLLDQWMKKHNKSKDELLKELHIFL